MKINDMVDECYQTAVEKGWHEAPEKTELEVHMLIVSEVAEATECVRVREEDFWVDKDGKPCGEQTELADAVIRIADYFGSKGWDLDWALRKKMDYNKTRSHRHGGKLK